MPSVGPAELELRFDVGAVTNTMQGPAWVNTSDHKWTLDHAAFASATAITGHTTNYYGLAVHFVSTAGVHTTNMATLDFNQSQSHTANDPTEFTLSTTAANLVIDENEGLHLYFTRNGTAKNLPDDSSIALRFLGGEGAGQ